MSNINSIMELKKRIVLAVGLFFIFGLFIYSIIFIGIPAVFGAWGKMATNDMAITSANQTFLSVSRCEVYRNNHIEALRSHGNLQAIYDEAKKDNCLK